ncbi:hypothetical protein [Deinococcus sp. Leaf326]|uniref:hypothetical protein n=1 Tax=Deinococcus sp. Leaf326 TaxID=1736338 RepID=UPI0006FF8F3D|nr:hypothetical protein [Deinococcus sp. Leaf326]KQR07152.1 hypothetical protein ASF71_21170 [Deinococcus sp. Leaf326]
MDAQGVAGQVLDQLVRSEVLMLGGSVYVGAMARALKIEVSAVYGALGELVKLGWVWVYPDIA